MPSAGGVMTLGENMLLTGLFWEQYFRWYFPYSEILYSFSPMFSHLLSFLSLLRSWCVYSALARRHCYLLSAIKQRFVQFLCLYSAVWYFQFVWLFFCSDFDPVFADSTRVPDTSSQGGYWEGANALLSAYLLSSLSCRNSHKSLSFFLSDMGVCSETRSLQGSSA